jgi:hypothetical protein|tara:strand:+ start:82 stop:381 length:300 start_codon:yes stop_codon:yes gene_type:complete
MNTKINNNLNITEGSFGYPSLQYSSPSVVSEKDEYKMINEIKNQIEILLSLLGDQDSEKKENGIYESIHSLIDLIQIKSDKDEYDYVMTVLNKLTNSRG